MSSILPPARENNQTPPRERCCGDSDHSRFAENPTNNWCQCSEHQASDLHPLGHL